ncbi:MAG: hypothetical protein WA728_04465 [Xanthobacteraceae bacterium]
MSVFLYALVYLLVCIGGNYLVGGCMNFIRRRVGLKHQPPSTERAIKFIGGTERAVALTLYLLAPRYLAAFIGGWILLKFALGWQRTPPGPNIASGSLLAMIGNVLSFAIAIAGGYYLHPGTLDYFGISGPIPD